LLHLVADTRGRSRRRKNVTKLYAPLLVVALTGVLAAGSSAGSTATTWKAKLSPSEVKPKQKVKNTTADGTFAGVSRGNDLKFTLRFAKLSSPATAAYIGYGKKGRPGNVSLVLCSPCQSPVVNTAGIYPALVKLLDDHVLFVAVATKKNPNGEIRGQLG
jgi:hypothetical protein